MEFDVIDGKYKVLGLIGSGGMADVYKAVSLTNRHVVAIKMLKSEFTSDGEFMRRFDREARASLRLSHDNIVRAYGVGVHAGRPYIVLEYVEGVTLKELIRKEGALPTPTAVGICCQILDALFVAHACGIIHRDVKPQNVIITPHGRAKLADFGIASDMKATTVTFNGSTVLGSVHYISPEQAENKPVTMPSDIYSVGVTLYEMITGQLPFTADTTVSVALMHINATPKAPKDVNPKIPAALSDIVMRAMEKNPADRYQSAKAMRQDLVRSLTNPQGSFARDRDVSSDTGRHKKRRKLSVYAIIGICVLVPVLVVLVAFIIFMSGGDDDNTVMNTAEPSQVPITTATPAPSVSVTSGASAPISVAIPDTVGQSADDALLLLYNEGFNAIFVSFIYTLPASSEVVNSNTVISQQPISGMADPDDPITLYVYRSAQPQFKADVSFTVDIPKSTSILRMTYLAYNIYNVPYYVVLYEAQRAKENGAVISAEILSSEPVGRNILFMIDGEVAASQTVTFG